MVFSDLSLSRRLESSEGHACAEFAKARRRSYPESGAETMKSAGAYVVFNGLESPVTQTFGLGILEELNAETLDRIEGFFFDRRAPVNHEVSPLAGVAAADLLCGRNYRPIEFSSVLYQPVERTRAHEHRDIQVRVTRTEEVQLWAEINARGWCHEHPELLESLQNNGLLVASRENSVSFLAEYDGVPGAVGALSLYDGVALFAGAATVPELRGRGLQAALLTERMNYAFSHGCDLAMMVTEVGSGSQRNAERKGFKIAYTRTKWRLSGSS
jgi:GNAT superfamily N-acetyltransferase